MSWRCEFLVPRKCGKSGDDYEYGISLLRYKKDVQELKNPDDVVIDSPTVTIRYNGTFSNGDGFLFTELSPNRKNFTRKDLVNVIGRRYKKMYETDDQWMSFYKGPYQIWGNGLEELYLVGMDRDDDTGFYELDVET